MSQSIILPVKSYSRYTETAEVPFGFQTMNNATDKTKWVHYNINCNISVKLEIFQSSATLELKLNNDTIQEQILFPINGNNRELIQFTVLNPTISCKYIMSYNDKNYLRRFQIVIDKAEDFQKIIFCLNNLGCLIKHARNKPPPNLYSYQGHTNNVNNAGIFNITSLSTHGELPFSNIQLSGSNQTSFSQVPFPRVDELYSQPQFMDYNDAFSLPKQTLVVKKKYEGNNVFNCLETQQETTIEKTTSEIEQAYVSTQSVEDRNNLSKKIIKPANTLSTSELEINYQIDDNITSILQEVNDGSNGAERKIENYIKSITKENIQTNNKENSTTALNNEITQNTPTLETKKPIIKIEKEKSINDFEEYLIGSIEINAKNQNDKFTTTNNNKHRSNVNLDIRKKEQNNNNISAHQDVTMLDHLHKDKNVVADGEELKGPKEGQNRINNENGTTKREENQSNSDNNPSSKLKISKRMIVKKLKDPEFMKYVNKIEIVLESLLKTDMQS